MLSLEGPPSETNRNGGAIARRLWEIKEYLAYDFDRITPKREAHLRAAWQGAMSVAVDRWYTSNWRH